MQINLQISHRICHRKGSSIRKTNFVRFLHHNTEANKIERIWNFQIDMKNVILVEVLKITK
jgi:hypothetical protein